MDIPETYPTITEKNVTYIGNLKKPNKRIIVWEIKRTILEPIPDILPDDISKENMINNFKKVIDKDAWYKRNFDLILKQLSTTILKYIYDQVSRQLERRNGYVVEFNKTISALTCCNNAVVLLGNSIQSKTALFYLSPYVAKNNVAIDQTLPILISAKIEIDIRESVADDSGTNVRKVQHWMTRTLNKMDIVSELHDTQTVAALFQLPTELCSESFILVGVHEAVAFIKKKMNLHLSMRLLMKTTLMMMMINI